MNFFESESIQARSYAMEWNHRPGVHVALVGMALFTWVVLLPYCILHA